MGTNEKSESKSFLDTAHDRSSCDICQCILKGCNGGLQSVTCWNRPTDEIRKSQCKVYTTSDGRLVRDKVFKDKEQQAGSTSNTVEEVKEREVLRPDTLHNDCFRSASSYHGSMNDKIEVKVALKELEKREDPFDLHCKTRGDWWEGSLYY